MKRAFFKIFIPVVLTFLPIGSIAQNSSGYVPEGYSLVWSDEFYKGERPGKDWIHENWDSGRVNHELQNYTDKEIDGKVTTEIKDGILHINCFKGSDGKIYSGRINALPDTGWK